MSLRAEPPLVEDHKNLYAIASDGDDLERERERLNFQHRSLTNLFGKKLILAPVSLIEGDRVLDCGTGTGIWAKDVANAFPDVVVEGTDISSRFFHPSGEITAVTFHTVSTFDLPTEWKNRFKFVNQRLMIGCFSRVQWGIALRQIHRVVQPGGWLQLIEVSHTYNYSATHPKYQKVLNMLYPMMRERGFILDTGADVEEMLRQIGFENVTRMQIPARLGEWGGERGREVQVWIQGAIEGMKGAMVQAETVGPGDEFERAIEEAFEECNQIPGVFHNMEIICGQKL